MRGAAIRLRPPGLIGELPPGCAIAESAHSIGRTRLPTSTYYLTLAHAGDMPERLAAFLAANAAMLEDTTLYLSGKPTYFLWEWRIVDGRFVRREIAADDAHAGLYLYDHHPELHGFALDLLAAGWDDGSLLRYDPDARAERALSLLTTLRPHSWHPWLELGYAQGIWNQLEASEHSFARALELAPESEKPWCVAGLIETIEKSDGPRALAYARRSKLEPDTYERLAALEREYGAPSLAREASLVFLRSFDPHMGERLWQIARLRELQGDPHAADWRRVAVIVDESLAGR